MEEERGGPRGGRCGPGGPLSRSRSMPRVVWQELGN